VSDVNVDEGDDVEDMSDAAADDDDALRYFPIVKDQS